MMPMGIEVEKSYPMRGVRVGLGGGGVVGSSQAR